MLRNLLRFLALAGAGFLLVGCGLVVDDRQSLEPVALVDDDVSAAADDRVTEMEAERTLNGPDPVEIVRPLL